LLFNADSFETRRNNSNVRGKKMRTTIKTVLVWVSILGLGLGAWAEGATEEKLINPEDIIAGFEQGREKVKVIINLAEPQRIKSTTDWNSMQSLERLHNETRDLQAPVLSMLSSDEFKLRHRFENQAGFSGEVTLEGLARLLNDPRVESIEPVYILQKTLAQGVPLINASAYRSTYNGQGVAIAICDDGIDYNHPKLGGRRLPE
jgi:subtilisin family serine protease